MGWGVTISICKTYVFEFIFSLELHNFLGILKSEGIYTTHFFLNLKLKKKKKKKKKIHLLPPNLWRSFSSRGEIIRSSY